MKKKEYDNDGRQLVRTGWKLFDCQTNLITAGQCMSNTQFSMCIRPWTERNCNGFEWSEGHLFDFDMKPFAGYGIPRAISLYLKDRERTEEVILYMFFTRTREGRVEPFCWVVTDMSYRLVKCVVVCGYGQHHWKRYKAASEILSYITES